MFLKVFPHLLIKNIIFDSGQKRIEFRNVENLDELVLNHSVAPHEPGYMCTIPPATLLFEDQSSEPRVIHKLDCSGFPSRIFSVSQSIHTAIHDIWDMSFTEHEGKRLLFIAEGYGGLFAYNYDTWDLEWSVKGRLNAGLTTDARGHLFHCVESSIKRCVKVFTTKGADLGVLQIEKDEFPEPWRIRWCRETSSLVMAHKRDWQWFISVITAKYPE